MLGRLIIMPQPHTPVVYVIGGPNGAGKTTFAREFLPASHVVEFLNTDLLAAGLSPLQPGSMAVRSARLLLARWRELLTLRRDFAFESTLSGRTYAGMLRQARAKGYEVRLCYLWLPNVGISLRRVRQRVRKGGHDVPEADLRRRFLPSLRNFFSLYLPLADQALLFNAAGNPPQLIARWTGSAILLVKPDLYAQIQKQIQTSR
jgi:predicted ABC-type ATPase